MGEDLAYIDHKIIIFLSRWCSLVAAGNLYNSHSCQEIFKPDLLSENVKLYIQTAAWQCVANLDRTKYAEILSSSERWRPLFLTCVNSNSN